MNHLDNVKSGQIWQLNYHYFGGQHCSIVMVIRTIERYGKAEFLVLHSDGLFENSFTTGALRYDTFANDDNWQWRQIIP